MLRVFSGKQSDAACWRSKTSGATGDCTVMVDRNVALEGLDGGVTVNNTTVTVFYSDLPRSPKDGDTLTVGTAVYSVVRVLELDESRAVCLVRES